uniref:Uncharacterized protein n=1 Tax=Myoviridae sp. ctIty1 TaxID=2827673 RepID=A0A8S5TGT1_9CAUD|nr:MAG TPA: hypothetical protein [Myoviridae sp. ctIty1]
MSSTVILKFPDTIFDIPSPYIKISYPFLGYSL